MVTFLKKRTCFTGSGNNGFTLIELIIALFVSGLVMAAVVTVYTAQTRSYTKQDDIADIQQNLRGALMLMPMEIRIAGCDPTETKVAQIRPVTKNCFQFTRDIRSNTVGSNDADGDVDDPDENIAYGFAANIDTNNNGIVDNGGADWSGIASLGRQSGNPGNVCAGAGGAPGFQPLADNIEALEFNYILSDGTTSSAPANPQDIRVVRVSILARASFPASDFVHSGSYTTASGQIWTPPQDRFRRRLVILNIQPRNMGY